MYWLLRTTEPFSRIWEHSLNLFENSTDRKMYHWPRSESMTPTTTVLRTLRLMHHVLGYLFSKLIYLYIYTCIYRSMLCSILPHLLAGLYSININFKIFRILICKNFDGRIAYHIERNVYPSIPSWWPCEVVVLHDMFTKPIVNSVVRAIWLCNIRNTNDIVIFFELCKITKYIHRQNFLLTKV